MWFLVWAFAAHADSLQLDNGAKLTGQLAAYEAGGTCRIAIGAGDLAGTEVVLPCSRITKFEKDPDDAPIPAATPVAEVAIEPPSP
jgi:hypothetical protein